MSPSLRRMLIWFGASLAVRLLLLLPVWMADVPLLYDEKDYVLRAEGFSALFTALLRGEGLDTAAWSQAYRGGLWPPLQALVLAPSMALGDAALPAARLVMVVLSAATTPLVERLARRMTCAPAAAVAAALHALYPTFAA